MRRLLLFLALPLALVGLTGCDDAASTETFSLPPRPVDFTFIFDGSDLANPNQLNEIQSEEGIDLTGYITQQGFTRADIVRVEIRNGSGEIVVQQPFDAAVNIFDRVQLQLFQGTQSSAPVASQNDFPSGSDRTSLNLSGVDIGSFVRTGPFSALLLADPSAAIDPAETYTVEVGFDVVIFVEG